MSKEDIVNRILSDAEAEEREILSSASARAEEIIAAASSRADKARAEAQAEADVRAKRITDGMAASARLDSAKILLAEKRRVIDGIYARALEKLLALSERDTLKFLEKLLIEHAEEGDEIVFAKNFAYAKGAAALPVVKERRLKISAGCAQIAGGCLLHGALCDKDLSYEALLNADKEEYQAEIAAKLFVS